MLKALTDFPSARFVVYSTCSIFSEENECVVRDVLKKQGKTWKTVDLRDLDSGMSPAYSKGLHFDEDLNCLRVCASCGPKNYLNGFFLAIFERILE